MPNREHDLCYVETAEKPAAAFRIVSRRDPSRVGPTQGPEPRAPSPEPQAPSPKPRAPSPPSPVLLIIYNGVVDNHNNETRRSRPRHARSAHPQIPRARAVARVGHRRPDPAAVARRAPGAAGLALSRAPAPRAPGVDCREMGHLRPEAPREILRADARRTPAARTRSEVVGAARRRRVTGRADS